MAEATETVPDWTSHHYDRLPDTTTLLARGALSLAGRPGARAGLPRREVVVAEVTQDLTRYAQYTRVVGATLRDRVLPTWLHVLTFPLQLDLLTSTDFPFPAVGLVHISNEMRLHRPVEITETLTIAVHTANLRPHKSGAALDFRGRIEVGEETVWEGVSTYLARGAKLTDDATRVEADGQADHGAAPLPGAEDDVPVRARWRVDGRLIRGYARASGDLNPIHLNPLLAKAFGFPRAIAHGMWSHARALAALDSRLPETYTAAVEFKKPVLLPATLAFGSRLGEAGTQYTVTSKGGENTHVLGSISRV